MQRYGNTLKTVSYGVVQTVSQQAKSALENPRLTGEAEVKESEATRSGDQNLPPNQGFDMGQVPAQITLFMMYLQLLL